MNDQQKEVQERPFGGFGDSSNYEGPLEDGKFYPAVLLGVKERFIDAGQYPGWKVMWGFDLTLPDGSTERLEGMSSQATGPDSKAGDWLVSLVGQQRYDERGKRLITKEELRNIACQVYVKFSDKGWPRVGGVFPAQNASQQAPQPPVAPNTPPQSSAPPEPSSAPTTTASDFDDLPW